MKIILLIVIWFVTAIYMTGLLAFGLLGACYDND